MKVCKVSVCFTELKSFTPNHEDQETPRPDVNIDDAKGDA